MKNLNNFFNLFSNRKILFLIFFFALILRIVLFFAEREANLKLPWKGTTDQIGSEFLRDDATMYTAFVTNYFKYNIWSAHKNYPIGLIRKTPGYPLFLSINYILFGEKYYLWVVVLFQLIL